MTRAVDHVSEICGVRALTLQGAGIVFCAGGNPYGSSSPASLGASSQKLLASVQVSPPCPDVAVLFCGDTGAAVIEHGQP